MDCRRGKITVEYLQVPQINGSMRQSKQPPLPVMHSSDGTSRVCKGKREL